MSTLQTPTPAIGTTAPPRPPARRRRRQGRAPRALIVAATASSLFAVAPLGYLAVRALGGGLATLLGVLTGPRTAELAARSIGLTAAVTAACLVLGTVGAWLVTTTDLPGRRVWGVLLVLPLALPSYVAGFTWIAQWPELTGFAGAFAVLTAVSFPYVFLPVAAALRAGDGGLEEVARSLGHNPARVLFGVTLRRVWPAASAGGLLVALYVLSDFGAVSLMRYDAFTLGIYTSYRATFDRTPAAVLGCVLVVLAAVITWAESRARGRAVVRVGRGAARAGVPVHLHRARLPALAFVGVTVAVSLGVPAYGLVRWTLAGSSAGIDWPELGAATAATLQAALLGALLTIVVALPVGMVAARYGGRWTGAIETAAYAGHALPGVTIGLALVFVGIRVMPAIYQEIPLLVIGYAVAFLPLAIGAVRTAVAAAPPRVEEVARSLGHGPVATFARVTLPLAAPGVAAGAALVFLTCAKELPITLMLHPTGTNTLAVQMWSHTGAGAFAAAAPYAVALVLLAAVPTLWLDRVLRR
jgi:iron(III) transport system permease protein